MCGQIPNVNQRDDEKIHENPRVEVLSSLDKVLRENPKRKLKN